MSIIWDCNSLEYIVEVSQYMVMMMMKMKMKMRMMMMMMMKMKTQMTSLTT